MNKDTVLSFYICTFKHVHLKDVVIFLLEHKVFLQCESDKTSVKEWNFHYSHALLKFLSVTWIRPFPQLAVMMAVTHRLAEALNPFL